MNFQERLLPRYWVSAKVLHQFGYISDHIPKNIPADLNIMIHVTGDIFSSSKEGGGGGGVLNDSRRKKDEKNITRTQGFLYHGILIVDF